jgi:hypothetical protein
MRGKEAVQSILSSLRPALAGAPGRLSDGDFVWPVDWDRDDPGRWTESGRTSGMAAGENNSPVALRESSLCVMVKDSPEPFRLGGVVPADLAGRCGHGVEHPRGRPDLPRVGTSCEPAHERRSRREDRDR